MVTLFLGFMVPTAALFKLSF